MAIDAKVFAVLPPVEFASLSVLALSSAIKD
jgi:hypothetical protein